MLQNIHPGCWLWDRIEQARYERDQTGSKTVTEILKGSVTALVAICHALALLARTKLWQTVFGTFSFVCFVIFFFFGNRVSLCNSTCPETLSLNQIDLELRHLPASVSKALGVRHVPPPPAIYPSATSKRDRQGRPSSSALEWASPCSHTDLKLLCLNPNLDTWPFQGLQPQIASVYSFLRSATTRVLIYPPNV